VIFFISSRNGGGGGFKEVQVSSLKKALEIVWYHKFCRNFSFPNALSLFFLLPLIAIRISRDEKFLLSNDFSQK
jgi:hypothetical protein